MLMSCFVKAVERAKKLVSIENLFISILTLDIRNVFNSAPYARVKDALTRNNLPGYL